MGTVITGLALIGKYLAYWVIVSLIAVTAWIIFKVYRGDDD